MIFRPSNAYRFMRCALSVSRVPDRPEQDDDAAREGTCAAWVSEVVINGDASCAEDMLGKTHSNGWTVDEEMVRHTQGYIDILQKRENPRAEVFMKHDIGLQGTADGMAHADGKDLLYIDDLKYGYGIVNVRNNWQLLCYLWLHVATTGLQPRLVQLSIYQPRALHKDGVYRKWVIGPDEYLPLLGQISQRITDIKNGEASAVPGDHCVHCALAVGCDALTQSVYKLADIITTSRTYRQPDGLQLSDELTMLTRMSNLLKARYAAVASEAEARLEEQQFVPGWVLEKRWGKKKFTVNDTSIKMVTGIDPTVTTTCTPAELIRRGADTAVVDGITTTPFIGVNLASIDAEDVNQHFNNLQKGADNG